MGKKMNRDRCLLRSLDDKATDSIPIRFIMSIAIIVVVLVLVTVASESLRVSLAEHQIEDECRILQSSLSTMIASGVARDVDAGGVAAGTRRIQTITLPDSLLFLSFGGCSDSINSGADRSTLAEEGSALSFKVQGGSIHIIWFPKEIYKFHRGTLRNNTWIMNDTTESFTISQSGTTTLVFELVQKNHVNYILIYPEYGVKNEGKK
jgi:hypothetical protein